MKSHTTQCIILADGEPVALIRPEGGGAPVLGYASDDDTATMFASIEDAEAAITRTPDAGRWNFRIIRLIASSITLDAAPENLEHRFPVGDGWLCCDGKTAADNGGRA